MAAGEGFIAGVSTALEQLYMPDRLRRSSLTELFGVSGRYDAALAMQRILTEAIQALKPPRDEPRYSRSWRLYYSLQYRYVEQMSQRDSASQMGVSTRQLRRDEHLAREMLANLLWERFGVDGDLAQDHARPADATNGEDEQSSVEKELEWLRLAPPQECVADPNVLLPGVLSIARVVAVQHGADLRVEIQDELPPLATHPVALRQVLLNLLSVAIPRASGGEVRLFASSSAWQVEIWVQCAEHSSGPQPSLEQETALLNMAHRLVDLSRCTMDLAVDAQSFDARIAIPAVAQLPVLAIDDNADTLRLLQRYAGGTRYRVFCAADPEAALKLAAEITPRIILLDVMMPQVDGWEALSRLLQHPLTAGIPIVVCTILPQEDLALLLGAKGFLRKPVSRQDFLATLDKQMAHLAEAADPEGEKGRAAPRDR